MLPTVIQNTGLTANPQSLPPTPGVYPGPGQAALLRPGTYAYLIQNQLWTAGKSSIAVQLERTKSGFFYPVGYSMEVSFSGAPGTFEVDIQTSDTDQDGFYVTNTKLTSGLNANNVGRIEMVSYWALFTRVNIPTLTNAVTVTVKMTR
jgi:hypothetical protein